VNQARATEWASRATLSGVCCVLPVDHAQIAQYLGRLGPLRIDGPISGEHVLLCELWTVSDGRATPGGLDLGEAVIGWAGAAAGLCGLWWGAGLGGLAGAASKGDIGRAARAGARTGFEEATAATTHQLRRVARAVSLGPYHELMLAVPDVYVGDEDTPHLAVLAMVTDSQTALAIDGGFGYGYAKQLARFEVSGPGQWSVAVAGNRWIDSQLSHETHRSSDVERLNHWWSQPLLGGVHDGRWASARLERFVDVQSPTWSSLGGSVQVSATPPELGGDISYAVGAHHVGSALAFRDIASRISFPRRLM